MHSLKHKQCRTCIVAPFSYTAATSSPSLKNAACTKKVPRSVYSLAIWCKHSTIDIILCTVHPLVQLLGIKLASIHPSIHSPLTYKSGYITIDLFFSHKMFFSHLFFLFLQYNFDFVDPSTHVIDCLFGANVMRMSGRP